MLVFHGNYNNRRAMLTSHNEQIDNLIDLTYRLDLKSVNLTCDIRE
jgi:hypothetical protein